MNERKKIFIVGCASHIGLSALTKKLSDYDVHIVKQAPVEKKPEPIKLMIQPYDYLKEETPVIHKSKQPWYTHFDKFKKRKK